MHPHLTDPEMASDPSVAPAPSQDWLMMLSLCAFNFIYFKSNVLVFLNGNVSTAVLTSLSPGHPHFQIPTAIVGRISHPSTLTVRLVEREIGRHLSVSAPLCFSNKDGRIGHKVFTHPFPAATLACCLWPGRHSSSSSSFKRIKWK